MRVLFLCSQNRLRSPTAEVVFSNWPGVQCTSAGTNRGADTLLSRELVAWAEFIFCHGKAASAQAAFRISSRVEGRARDLS